MTEHYAELLLAATRQDDVPAALRYLSEGLFVDQKFSRPDLLAAVCALADISAPPGVTALRRLTREAARSELNTSAELLQPDWITPPSTYKAALDRLATKTPSGTLADVTFRHVLAAQRDNPNVVISIAAAAGLSWNELVERADLSSPSEAAGPWTPESVRIAFELIDDIVNDRISARLPGGFPSRPIELLGDPDVAKDGQSSWDVIERFRSGGVPYEVLLAQRTEGGSWRTHRDRIGRRFAHVIADELSGKLTAAGVEHLRTTNCGGDVSRSRTNELVGGGGEQVALVILDRSERPAETVAISVANDGGSAAKSGGRLAKLPGKVSVPVSVVVAGLGWAHRNETAELAAAVEGRIYSEQNMSHLVARLRSSTTTDITGTT